MYNNNVILNVLFMNKTKYKKKGYKDYSNAWCQITKFLTLIYSTSIPNAFESNICMTFQLQKRTCWACVTRKIAAYVFRRTCVWMLEHVCLPSGHAHADRDGAAHVQAERVRVSLHAWGGSEEPAHKDDGRTGHREHQEPVPQKVTDPLWQTRSGRRYTHIYADAFNQKEEQKQQYSEYLD